MAGIDASIEVKVSDNHMKVLCNYIPAVGAGNDLSFNDVIKELKSLNVVVGINEINIRAICDNDKPMRNIVVAEGIKPDHGEKAKLVPYYDLNEGRKAVKNEDGSVDFRNLGNIPLGTVGQELYRKVPATIGSSGKDVLGNEIPGIAGKDLNLVIGKGTELDESDENLVRSSIDGEIHVNNSVVQVESVHRVKGDVDYSTGNIKFNGIVKISGTVKSGFKVEAEGDVEVHGNVEDADVSSDNDVIVHGGVSGKGEGSVSAKRDVVVKFVENQRIVANRDIIIKGHSYHANLSAGGSVISKGSKSVIVGGQCEAKVSVDAKRLGSDANTRTIIKVGVDPKIAERMALVDEEIMATKEKQKICDKNMAYLKRQKLVLKDALPAGKLKLLEKMETTKTAILDKIKALESKKEEIKKERKELKDAEVRANAAVFPKVIVFFGDQIMAVSSKLGPSTFRLVKGDIARLSK